MHFLPFSSLVNLFLPDLYRCDGCCDDLWMSERWKVSEYVRKLSLYMVEVIACIPIQERFTSSRLFARELTFSSPPESPSPIAIKAASTVDCNLYFHGQCHSRVIRLLCKMLHIPLWASWTYFLFLSVLRERARQNIVLDLNWKARAPASCHWGTPWATNQAKAKMCSCNLLVDRLQYSAR